MQAYDTNTLERLRKAQSWSGFAASLVRDYDRKGDLTVPQWQAAERMFEKMDAKKAAKEKNTRNINVWGINALFAASKLKQPKFFFDAVVLSLAGPNSVNAGAIYVKERGDYKGKIMDGKFQPVYGCPSYISDTIAKVAEGLSADGIAYLAKYGKEGSFCACCGAPLTSDKVGPDGKTSKERGIGPKCAKNMGLL